VILWNWTDAGIKDVKKSPERVETLRKSIEKAGGKLTSFYYPLGEFDGVAVVDMASDEAFIKVLLGIGIGGNVRTRSLKAWSPADAVKVIGQL
jgi:uncharacterized protein with GYD domain